jgi:hypothetical protein
MLFQNIIAGALSQVIGSRVLGLGMTQTAAAVMPSPTANIASTTFSVVLANTVTNPRALFQLLREGCIGLSRGAGRALCIWTQDAPRDLIAHSLGDISTEAVANGIELNAPQMADGAADFLQFGLGPLKSRILITLALSGGMYLYGLRKGGMSGHSPFISSPSGVLPHAPSSAPHASHSSPVPSQIIGTGGGAVVSARVVVLYLGVGLLVVVVASAMYLQHKQHCETLELLA